MSLDTYMKRKDVSRYHTAQSDDVVLMLSPTLGTWAQSISITAKRFLFWTTLAVNAVPIHAHAPGVA